MDPLQPGPMPARATNRPEAEAPSAERERRRAVLDAACRAALPRGVDGTGAARSQDFLYREDGLPV